MKKKNTEKKYNLVTNQYTATLQFADPEKYFNRDKKPDHFKIILIFLKREDICMKIKKNA